RRAAVEVGILADLPGPKIRIDRFHGGSVQLRAGDRFNLHARADAPPGDASGVGVSYLGLPGDVAAGDVLLLDDGMVQLRVLEVDGDTIATTVLNDGVLSDRNGLNKQGVGRQLVPITDVDGELFAVAADIGVDFTAVSFCRTAADMHEAPRVARMHGSAAALVSKIERAEAIVNLGE